MQLQISWSDGHLSIYNFQNMRDNCPCASCKGEIESHEGKMMLPILTPNKYELKDVQQVGSYALQLLWGDGHKTGIYTFQQLRDLCECVLCKT